MPPPGDDGLDVVSNSDAGEGPGSVGGGDYDPRQWRFEGEEYGGPQQGFRDDLDDPSTSYGAHGSGYRSLRSSVNNIKQGRSDATTGPKLLLSASQYHQRMFSKLNLTDRVHPLSHLELGSAHSSTKLPNVNSAASSGYGYGGVSYRPPSTTKSLPAFGNAKRGGSAPTDVTRDRGNHASIPFGLPGNRATDSSLPNWPSRKAFSTTGRSSRLRPSTSPLGGQMSYEEKQALMAARLGASMVMAEGKRTLLSAEEKSVEDQKLYIASLAEQFNVERLSAERKEAELQELTTEFETLSAAKLAWDKVVYEGGGGGVPNTEEGLASSHLTPDMLLARTQVAEEAVAEISWQTREMNYMIERLQQEQKRDSIRANEMSRELEKINLQLNFYRKDLKKSEDTMNSSLAAYAILQQQMEMAASGHKARMDARRAIDAREKELDKAADERAMRAATVIPNMIREEIAKMELETRQRHIIQMMQEQAWVKRYEEMQVVMNKLHRLQVVLGVGTVEELMSAVKNRDGRTKLVEESMRDAEARKAARTEEISQLQQTLARIQYESEAHEDKQASEDDLLRDMTRAERRLEAASGKYDALAQLVAQIYSGLLALLERFDSVKLDSHRANFRAGNLLLHQVPKGGDGGEAKVTSAPVQSSTGAERFSTAAAAAAAAAQPFPPMASESSQHLGSPGGEFATPGSRAGSRAGSDTGGPARAPIRRTSSMSGGSVQDMQLPSTASIIAANPALLKAQQKMQAAQQQQQRAVEDSLRPARKSASSQRGASGRKSVSYGEGRRSGASTPTRMPSRLSGASTDSDRIYLNPNMKLLGTAELHEAVVACMDLLGQRMERVEWAIAHPPQQVQAVVSKGPSRWHNINKTLKRASLSNTGPYSPMDSERDYGDEAETAAATARKKAEGALGPGTTRNNMRIRASASSENGDGTATPSAAADSDDSDMEDRSGMKRLADQRMKKKRDDERKARIMANEPPFERKLRIDREQRNERLKRLAMGLSSVIPTGNDDEDGGGHGGGTPSRTSRGRPGSSGRN